MPRIRPPKGVTGKEILPGPGMVRAGSGVASHLRMAREVFARKKQVGAVKRSLEKVDNWDLSGNSSARTIREGFKREAEKRISEIEKGKSIRRASKRK